MTKANTRFILHKTGPGTYRLKVGNHKVIIHNWQAAYFMKQLFDLIPFVGFHIIDPSFFSENETQAIAIIFDIKRQCYVSLSSADQNINFTMLVQKRDNIFCPANMSIAGALYGV
jgi:hypothetical protein